MSQQAELLMLKGVISDLPPEKQEQIKKVAQEIRVVVEANGDEGILGMAIYALELQAGLVTQLDKL